MFKYLNKSRFRKILKYCYIDSQWKAPPKSSFIGFLSHWHVCSKLLQSCLTLCDPTNCSLPGSSANGILQARTLEWLAMPFSRGPSWPRDRLVSLMSPTVAGGFFTTSTTWQLSTVTKELSQTLILKMNLMSLFKN